MKFALALLAACFLGGCAAPHNTKSVAAQPSQERALRAFRVDLKTFWPKFDQTVDLQEKMLEARPKGYSFTSFNATEIYNQALRDLFEQKERMSLEPMALFFNDSRGIVFVHGTPRECEAVRRLLIQLEGKPVELDVAQYKLGKIQPASPRQ